MQSIGAASAGPRNIVQAVTPAQQVKPSDELTCQFATVRQVLARPGRLRLRRTDTAMGEMAAYVMEEIE